MKYNHRINGTIKLKFKNTNISCMYLLIAMLLPSCAVNNLTRFKPFEADNTADYCQAKLIGKAKSMPQSESDILENKLRIKDEITIALMLKSAAMKIVEQSDSVENCQQVFKLGAALFTKSFTQNLQKFGHKKGFKPASDTQIYEVQQRITELWRADQSARITLVGLPNGENKGAVFWANRLATAQAILVDKEATQYLEDLLKQYDWIDQQRFGVAVSAHAWILIQHADDRVDLQTEVLERMEPYFKNGGIKPANYAYLWDRVAVNNGRLQRYGTQPIWTCKDGQLELQPVEDLDRANLLRKKLVMNTVEAGLAEMSASVCAGH